MNKYKVFASKDGSNDCWFDVIADDFIVYEHSINFLIGSELVHRFPPHAIVIKQLEEEA